MDNFYDYKKFAVLYVDDEEMSLKYFARAFDSQFRIFTANNAQDALKLLEAHQEEIGVLMTDQRMPGEKGVWLLERARQLRPRIIRLLATAYSDLDAAVAAVNSGAIYKYIHKPWEPPQLEVTIKRALEFFIVQSERDQLLHEKLSVLHNMMIRDRIVGLGLLAAGMSHHIRNSLVAVKTFLDLAPAKLREENIDLNRLRNPDFWKEYYVHVQGQIDKINSLLKDLWSVSDVPKFEFNDRVRLREVVGEVIAKMERNFAAKNLAVENQIPDSLPLMAVDKPKICRLFELLLKDEIVSLPMGCRVVITGRMAVSPGTREPEVEIQLRDNGPGLPDEALRMIFDPFVVRSESPAEYGINLMASYLIVHHHGGSIQARNESGQGTVFTLRLPTDPDRAVLTEQSRDFLDQVLVNEGLWQKLLATP